MSSLTRTRHLIAGAIAFPLLLGALGDTPAPKHDPQPAADQPAANQYVGAQACKNCHSAESKGSQQGKWTESKHAKTFELLATPAAKEVGAKVGVTDPQKSEKCLPCHVTAHGAPAAEIRRGFKPELGVQCESCHGPGGNHIKARMAAAAEQTDAYVAIPKTEITGDPGVKACNECHNEKSPTFKPFCFADRREKIEHLDPRKKRTPEELAARKCGCGKDCKCKNSECSAGAEAMPKDAGAKEGKADAGKGDAGNGGEGKGEKK
jgi:mono/diheme cytochrome c family protein